MTAPPGSREPHGVPRPLSGLVGRERELTTIRRSLATGRLLTITGAGGCGKTRVATEVAAAMAPDLSGGSWWVELVALTDPGLVVSAVAAAFGVREQPGAEPLHALAARIADQDTFVVLDNCEHVLDAVVAVVVPLLERCTGLRVLATSREALGVPGENVLPLPTLPVPDPANLPPLASLNRYDAVTLLLARITEVEPFFVLDEDNASAVARICRRLDGLPLAIELAAARVRTLDIAEIADRLESSFALLSGGSRTGVGRALSRRRTVQATIEWSHQLLDESERVVFRRLGVFVGGFSMAAAEVICAGTDLAEGQVLEQVDQLVQKSLVEVTKAAGRARYRLLETVREYAVEQLRANGEEAELQARHAAYFVTLAEAIEPRINTSERRASIGLLAPDHDNFRAVLEYSRRTGDAVGPRLAGALLFFWWFGGHAREGRRWLEDAVARLREIDPLGRALARARTGAGLLAWIQAEYEQSRLHLTDAIALWRTFDEPAALAHALRFLSQVYESESDLVTARSLVEESLALFRGEADDFGTALSLARLGITAVGQDDDAVAKRSLEESIAIARRIADDWVLALALRHRGIAALRDADYPSAVRALHESLQLVTAMNDRFMAVQSMETLAEVLAVAGDPARAAQLFGVLETVRGTISVGIIYGNDYRAGVDAARAALGDAAFTDAWDAGRRLTLPQAVEVALQPLPASSAGDQRPSDATDGPPSSATHQPARPATHQPAGAETNQPPGGLSDREAEILTLVGRGMTNNEIAAALFLSARTVNWHLSAVYRKLGVRSRTEAARYGIAHGLR